MSFRSADEAARDFRETVVHALSPITPAHVYVPTRDAASGTLMPLTINRGLPVPLNRRVKVAVAQISLFMSMAVRAVGGGHDWRISTIQYIFAIRDGEQKILSYHWHPDNEDVRFPHLHLDQGASVGRTELASAHLPTGRVLIEDVVYLLIKDFNVERADDWEARLATTRARFAESHTWGASPPR